MKASVPTRAPTRGKRIYRFAPKVRTGCSTCRARRVKCDEGKPGCRRCSDFGVECGGYNRPAVSKTMRSPLPIDRTQRVEALTTQDLTTKSPPPRISETVSVLKLFGKPEEQRALSVYLSTVAVAISEFSSPSFWQNLIPQASWAHPGIKHALIALTSRHVSLKSVKTDPTRPDDVSIWHYNQSIRFLLLDAPTDEVTLLVCFLLFTYENSDGSFAIARQHMKSGLKIIKQWQYQRKSTSRDDLMSLEIIPRFREGLAYLKACSTGRPFSPTVSNPHQSVRITETQDPDEDIPSPPSSATASLGGTFSSFEEACNTLIECLRQTSLFSHAARTATLSPLLLRWKRTLDSSQRLESCDSSLVRMLNVHYYTCRTIVGSMQSGTEDMDQAYDTYLNEFTFIVDEMQVLINNTQVRNSIHLRQKLGFIPPLILVALRCPGFNLRIKAIAMLRKLQSKEGRWTSYCAAKISETCMTWEAKELDSFKIPYTGVNLAQGGGKKRLGRIRVEVSKESVGHRTVSLTSEKAAPSMLVALSQEEIEAVDWPIRDVLDAYGYQNRSTF